MKFFGQAYKKLVRQAITALLVLMSCPAMHAQQVQVKAEVTAGKIKIGEQFHLKVSAKHDDKTAVSWPGVAKMLGDKFEIIRQDELDTAFEDGKKKIIFSQDFTLTSFDSGRQVIPAFEFLYFSGNDTLHAFTDSLAIEVATVDVDTTKGFYDISGPVDAPFSYKEILPYVVVIGGGVIILLVLFFVARYLILRSRRRKKTQVKAPPPAPRIPAHTIAFGRLEALKGKKLWQTGQVKEYYVELTDILREYIHNRYTIDASEMTTDETLRALRLTDASPEAHNRLGQVLRLADLVKFAKAQPLPSEHELVLESGELFVRATLLEQQSPPVQDINPDEKP